MIMNCSKKEKSLFRKKMASYSLWTRKYNLKEVFAKKKADIQADPNLISGQIATNNTSICCALQRNITNKPN